MRATAIVILLVLGCQQPQEDSPQVAPATTKMKLDHRIPADAIEHDAVFASGSFEYTKIYTTCELAQRASLAGRYKILGNYLTNTIYNGDDAFLIHTLLELVEGWKQNSPQSILIEQIGLGSLEKNLITAPVGMEKGKEVVALLTAPDSTDGIHRFLDQSVFFDKWGTFTNGALFEQDNKSPLEVSQRMKSIYAAPLTDCVPEQQHPHHTHTPDGGTSDPVDVFPSRD